MIFNDSKFYQKHLVSILTVLSVAFASLRAIAADDLMVNSEKRVGAYFTVIGEPIPSLFGANLTYAVFDFAKVHVGLNSIPLNVSYGVGFRAFLKPLSVTIGRTKLVPLLGASASRFASSMGDCEPKSTCESIPTNLGYLNAGVEWIVHKDLGINFGALPIIFDSNNKPSHLRAVYPYCGFDINF